MPKTILIVGAGLAGSLLAVMLAREGFDVQIYERRPDPRAKGFIGGRSINLALSTRGIDALTAAGLAERVMTNDALPMRGRMIHPPVANPTLAFQPYSANPADAINSVLRGGLNLTLLHAAAEHANVQLHFDHCCTDVDLQTTRPAAIFSPVTNGGLPAAGAPTLRVEADLILAADGAFSPVRTAMQKTDRFDYSQTYLSHGYKELHIPPGADGGFASDPAALHIWPRGGAMMIALPNRDQSFTCTLFWPQEGEHSFANLRTPEQILAFFSKHYPDAVALMPTLVHDFQSNPTSSLVTIRCFPWQVGGKVALLGDAAHALVPFYGQGMNAAFEDCKALVEAMMRHGASGRAGTLGDTRAALEAFQQRRKPHADAIADMALENFIEMRDKVGSSAFLYRKKVEQALHKLFPERCEPQYHLVSFSTVPYAEARRRGRELDALYDAVIAQLPPGSEKSLSDQAWLAQISALAEVFNAESAEIAEGTLGSVFNSQSPHSSACSGLSALKKPETDIVFDISPLLSPRTKVWPGDSPLTREVLCDIPKGDNITLSTLRATVHLGSHADGPNHYIHPGRSIDQQPLNHYLGPCHVVDVKVARGVRIKPADLIGGLEHLKHPRILLRTCTFPDPETWTEDFAAISVELINALALRGTITIGIDTPSVDLFSSKDLPAHKAIAAHDIAILEGLILKDVAPGEYELIALPLKLEGFDASPIRAVLRPLPA